MVQFFHKLQLNEFMGRQLRNKHCKRFTLAYEPKTLTIAELMTYLTDPNKKLIVKMGKANCHHQDQFNKKIGRELALSRMIEVPYKLSFIQPANDYLSVTFRRDIELDENGAIIDQNKQAVNEFRIIIFNNTGNSRIYFYDEYDY